MPPTTYHYTISVDFPNQRVAPTALEEEIKLDAAITIALDFITVNVTPDDCAITFVDALPTADETALDALVAAHQGVRVLATLMGTLPVANLVTTITEDLTWELLDGVVTTPSFFSKNMSALIGRVIGQYKGDGGELRVMEEVEGLGDEPKVNPPVLLPDSGGQWARFTVDTDVPPRDGYQNIYRVEGRLAGATSLEIRYSTFSMLHVRQLPGIGP